MARPDFLAGRDEPHRTGVLQHGAAARELDARALERRRVGELEPRDLAVLVGDEPRPVEDRLVHGPAVARRVLEVVGIARGVDQQFLGDATADHAGAADPELLGHDDFRAVTGGDPCRAHAARPRSDHEEIDDPISHGVPRNPSSVVTS